MDSDDDNGRFVRVQLADGEQMTLPTNLLDYFPTIMDALRLCYSNNNGEIPVLDECVTEQLLKWAMDAAVICRANYGTGIHSFSDLYSDVVVFNQIRSYTRGQESLPPMLTLFGLEDLPEVEDIPLLLSLVKALNWLAAESLLNLAIDEVYDLLRDMSFDAINKLFVRKKRKSPEEEKEPLIGLPLTPYYKKELLIQEYVSQELPYELVQPLLPVQRHINPISCGSEHFLFLKADGLYATGRNHECQLGRERGDNPIQEYAIGLTKLVEGPAKPLFIAASKNHSFCFTEEGVLYACGDNDSGQLGMYNQEEEEGHNPDSLDGPIAKWTTVGLKDDILLLETTDEVTMIVRGSGLYACGSNYTYQLGLEDVCHYLSFNEVKIEGRVIKIALGLSFSIVLTTRGLFGCGFNEEGELAEELTTHIKEMTKIKGIPSNEQILDIACSYWHTVVVTTESVYTCGLGKEGQLGLCELDVAYELTKIPDIEGKPLAVYACRDYTLLHTTTGLYACGANSFGLLGVGDQLARKKFTKMFGLEGEIQSVTPGKQQVFVLTTEGVYVSGLYKHIAPSVPKEKECGWYNVFTKLDLDMGYSWESKNNEPDKKQKLEK